MSTRDVGIDIIVGNRCRTAFDIAKDFVTEQSQGEWDDAMIRVDAIAIARIMEAYLAARLAETHGEAA